MFTMRKLYFCCSLLHIQCRTLSLCPRKYTGGYNHSAQPKEALQWDMESWLPLASWGQACGHPGRTDMKPVASGGAHHWKQDGSHLQAPASRCEGSIFPLGFAILPPSLSHCLWCTTSLQGSTHFFPPPPPSAFLRDDTTEEEKAVQSSSLSASFSFPLGTMTSSAPWKFRSPSNALTSVPGLRVPIKRGSQLKISTGHRRVLKLLGAAVQAPGKSLLCQDHEALRDCPVPPHAHGCLLFSSALSTK